MATATVTPIVRSAGKGRQPASVELVRDLRDELTAVEAERHDLGLRLGYISRILWRAVWTERLDLVSEIAGELDRVSGRLIARGGG